MFPLHVGIGKMFPLHAFLLFPPHANNYLVFRNKLTTLFIAQPITYHFLSVQILKRPELSPLETPLGDSFRSVLIILDFWRILQSNALIPEVFCS